MDPPERAADGFRGVARGVPRAAAPRRQGTCGGDAILRARAEAGARCSGAMLEGGPRPTKHRVPHCPAELPGVGVLPARVVGRDHDAPIGQVARDAVSERRPIARREPLPPPRRLEDRKSTRLNSSHTVMSYAVFCLKKKMTTSSAVS